jgi:outer membrane protein insertion porin family
MEKRAGLLLILVALMAVFSPVLSAAVIDASAAVTAAAATDDIIDSVKITGNSSVSSKEISDQISYGVGMVFSRYKTREDIRNLYKSGKFDDIKIYLDNEGGKNVLVIDVKEKLQIGKIVITGNKNVGDGDIKGKLDDEDKGIKIKEGEYLDEYKLKQAIDNIEQMYHERNFYYAKASYKLTPYEIENKDGKKQSKLSIEIIIDEGDKLRVTSITATGNKVFALDKIKGAMKTKEEGWFQSGTFSDNQLTDDFKAVLDSYYQEGYVKAKINGFSEEELELNKKEIMEKDVVIDKGKRTISINIPVYEGIKYTIKSITFTGSSIFKPGDFAAKITSAAGRTFNKLAFEKDLATIRSMFAEQGRIFAQVKDTYVYDDDTGNVAIDVAITDGPVAYINKIKIRGNYVTKDKVILRELVIKEGDPFDATKIKRCQEAIYNLGFFDNVTIDTEQVEVDKLNLIFEVQEKKTGNVGLGAGYSTVQGLVGYVQLSQSNLFGEGKLISADVQYGDLQKSWQLSYKDPWLFDTPTSAGVNLWNTYANSTYNNQGYDLDSYGFSVSLGRKIDDLQKAFLTYRYEEDTYSNVDANLHDAVLGTTNTAVTSAKGQISSISPSYTFDNRDDVFDASKGVYASVALQLGGGILGGDYNYIKETADLRYFVPSIWRFVLGVHVLMGNATTYSSRYGNAAVPVTEKFYCGGTDTVRGYEERAIGPLGGGDFTFVTNIEYKLKVIEHVLTLAVFYDAGNCWNNFNDVNWSDPYLVSSVGGGVRLTIPGTVMLIRLDWGYGLDPVLRVPGGKIHFNIGNIF